MKQSDSRKPDSPSQLIDARKSKNCVRLAGRDAIRIRSLINQADPDIIEERKWKKSSNGMAGMPVWSHDGIVCTGETYKNA